jgi:adenosylcobinamide kinase/adenosylcobinamide-phosphate guanylyltransferase
MAKGKRPVTGFSLIGGGARSGKSAFALRQALGHPPPRLFLATSEPSDDEMRERARVHRAERGAEFETIEVPRDLDAVVTELCRETRGATVVVVDCLTLWLSNLLLGGETPGDIERRVDALARQLARAPFVTLLVTNEVGMGLVPETALGRAFRDLAGRAHQSLAPHATAIYFAALGVVLRLKPGAVILAGAGTSS